MLSSDFNDEGLRISNNSDRESHKIALLNKFAPKTKTIIVRILEASGTEQLKF